MPDERHCGCPLGRGQLLELREIVTQRRIGVMEVLAQRFSDAWRQ
jgi:hypothetical protein